MPFTPSHIAAVLPLARGRLVPSALAIGAMIPDLPTFVRAGYDYHLSHSALGLVTVDPAAALVVFAAFHLVLRDPFVALLPAWIRARVPRPRRYGPRDVPMILVSAALGAATHLVWDTLTHRWGARFLGWSWSEAEVLPELPVYRLLQYGSGLVGLAIVVWWTARWLRRAPAADPDHPDHPDKPDRPDRPEQPDQPGPPDRPGPPGPPGLSRAARLGTWWAMGGVALATGIAWPLAFPPSVWAGWPGVMNTMVIGAMIGCCAVAFAYAVAWWVRRFLARAPVEGVRTDDPR